LLIGKVKQSELQVNIRELIMELQFKKFYMTRRGQVGFSFTVFVLSVERNASERDINVAVCFAAY
jgi:hypothetical protein